ncbi:hypothetical protein KBY96_14150 [Cyanobium sp. ATX 6A2]|uniref:hypothetical protein n=1 Tax=Cyanobium sp. ATX 6A2 TaxID=2823700 RepID=UPI0020CB8DCE|nr:hypothetical protein [Cyanobium sp. ATX 6A2]MCP9889065.1 hypothetical protein [Cyanobium sp. ATX 6A2]
MASPLPQVLHRHPPNQRLPRGYGLVVSDLYAHQHWVAPIPLNHLLRWAFAVWMRLRNPVPPGDVDLLSTRLLYFTAYRHGFAAAAGSRHPAGTALVFTRPTQATIAAAWGIHSDAEELVERILAAAIRSGPDPRNPPQARH